MVRPYSSRLTLMGAVIPGLLVCGMSVVWLAAMGSTIEASLHISHTRLGIVQSAMFAGNLLGSFLFAHFIRRHTLSVLGLAALLMLAVGDLLSTQPFLATLFAGRFCMGLSNCGLMLFGSTLAIRAWPARQEALLNLVHGTIVTGACFGMFLTLPLSQFVGGWQRLPLWFAALLLVPAALLVVRGGEPPAHRAGGGAGPDPVPRDLSQMLAGWWRLLRTPAILRTAPALIAYIIAESAVIVFFPLYAQKRDHVTAATAAIMAGLFIGGIVVGRLLVALQLGGRNPQSLTIGLMPAGSVVLLAALWPDSSTSLPMVGGLLAVGGALMGPVAPLAVGLAIRGTGDGREDVLALSNILLCVGGLAGGALVGWWCDVLGLGAALIVSLALLAFAALPLITARPTR